MQILGILISILSVFLAGCGGGSNGNGTIESQADPFCSTITSYNGGVTITGTAKYEYRNNGNGTINTTGNPIRQAEIIVLNSSGVTIQCGSTDDSGNFSIVVPVSSSTNTLKVNSRISNSVTKAYIMNDPTNKDHYSLETTFTPSSSISVGTLVATASGDILGGAFNILDRIYSANKFLYTSTANCTSTFSDCVPFTEAPLAYVYWKKGFNPGEYVSAGALSYYLPGENELYILGGSSGDVDNSDSDHFDNSVIVHEYGHFIEDNFSKTNSPGGSHTGNSIIDARLAWGEGWGDFFQAAVLNDPVYRDTSGNPDGSADVLFSEDLETVDHDKPSTAGEGNFREFAITRLLWDAIDSTNETLAAPADIAGSDTVTAPFSELWTVFTGPNSGFKSSSYHFRNIGLFHTIQQSLVGGSNWSSIRTLNRHRGDQTDYIRSVSTGSSCSATSIQAANMSASQTENGSATNSNQFASNDFYQISHPGGAIAIQLNYTTDATQTANLDLYLYKEDYIYANSTDILAQSKNTITTGTTSATESISTTLAAGVYVINIRVNTTVRLGSNTSYTLTYNGAQLCPN